MSPDESHSILASLARLEERTEILGELRSDVRDVRERLSSIESTALREIARLDSEISSVRAIARSTARELKFAKRVGATLASALAAIAGAIAKIKGGDR